MADQLRTLCGIPFGSHSKQLTNAGGERSARVGNWRIVYFVDEANQVVEVDAIGPRGEVYRTL